jgi:glucosamine-6-phosphate deaminase
VDIRVFASGEALAQAAAGRVVSVLRGRPDLVLGVPAGRTPVGIYAELARLHAAGEADFSRATAFALDEFVGIDATHPASFHRFIREHFAAPVGLPLERLHALNGAAHDLDAECARYEAAIHDAGGIGLQLLGIGANGHIGFNEPAHKQIARTHRVMLLEETRAASAPLFGGQLAHVPREALTMGVGTILNAEAVILLAAGEGKAASVERMVRGPISTQLPASLLQAHRSVEVYLDRAAASRLSA